MTTAQQVPAQGVPMGRSAPPPPQGVPAPAPGAQAPRAVPAPVQGAPSARATLPAQTAAEPAAAPDAALALPDEEAPLFEPQIMQLPVELDVVLPVRNFRVRNLLALQPQTVIESQWGHGDDVPVAAGAVRVAWGEFEVVDNQLAVRITRMD